MSRKGNIPDASRIRCIQHKEGGTGMDLHNYQITIGEILQNQQARALVQRQVPGLLGHPMLPMVQGMQLRQAVGFARKYASQRQIDEVLSQLEKL